MVRLVGTQNDKKTDLKTSFNSSMVRLVEKYLDSGDLLEFKFQFQYGAIGSKRLECKLEWLNMFQFQYGAIGSNRRNGTLDLVTTFQFQYGAIGRRTSRI